MSTDTRAALVERLEQYVADPGRHILSVDTVRRVILALSAPEERFSVYRDGSCVATNLLADPGAREVGYSIVRHCSAPPVAQGGTG